MSVAFRRGGLWPPACPSLPPQDLFLLLPILLVGIEPGFSQGLQLFQAACLAQAGGLDVVMLLLLAGGGFGDTLICALGGPGYGQGRALALPPGGQEPRRGLWQ